MVKILAINGSYRDNGITDQAVDAMARTAKAAGADVEVVLLRELAIDFCRNCRACSQEPGDVPSECFLADGMGELVQKIEAADAYILASPTNFGAITAIFKRFLERLICYGYWPWGTHIPKFRKVNAPKKKAVLVSSCAAPGIMGRWMYGTRSQLKTTAKTIGAKAVGTLFVGLIAKEADVRLSDRVERKAEALVAKLV